MAKKIKIALIYGGKSVEHEISIRSAKNVAAQIDRNKFDVILLGISKKGVWFLNDSMESEIEQGSPVAISLNAEAPTLIDQKNNQTFLIDVAFPILHGTDGEDGAVQGLFKALSVPVVGSGVLGSAVSMDKVISKHILRESGVPVANYLSISKSEQNTIRYSRVVAKLGLPFLVKSASLGSSVGVNKVKNETDFAKAIEEGFKYDSTIIMEQFIKGRELECAVIGNAEPKAAMACEVVLVKDYDFYTYTAKYLDNDAVRIDLPAKIEEKSMEKIRLTSIEAYKALRCEDFARVDLFLTQEGQVYINEINTIPGFTSVSMFPMMWQHMGLSYSELISELIKQCLDRNAAQKSLETHYTAVN